MLNCGRLTQSSCLCVDLQLLKVWPVCRNVKQYPEAKQIDGLLVMRIDSPIYFANVIPVREAIAKYQRRTIRALVPRGIALRYIIIDMSPVTDIDASAVHWLKVCRCSCLALLNVGSAGSCRSCSGGIRQVELAVKIACSYLGHVGQLKFVVCFPWMQEHCLSSGCRAHHAVPVRHRQHGGGKMLGVHTTAVMSDTWRGCALKITDLWLKLQQWSVCSLSPAHSSPSNVGLSMVRIAPCAYGETGTQPAGLDCRPEGAEHAASAGQPKQASHAAAQQLQPHAPPG